MIVSFCPAATAGERLVISWLLAAVERAHPRVVAAAQRRLFA